MKIVLVRAILSLLARFIPPRNRGKKLAAGIVVLVLPIVFMASPGTYDEFLSIAEWVVTEVTQRNDDSDDTSGITPKSDLPWYSNILPSWMSKDDQVANYTARG